MLLAAESTIYTCRYWCYVEVDASNCKYTKHDIPDLEAKLIPTHHWLCAIGLEAIAYGEQGLTRYVF